MADTAFSLDIQEKYTRVCDLHEGGGKIELMSLGIKPTAPLFFNTDTPQVIQKEVEIVTQLLESLKIKKKTVNVVVPDGQTYSQIVSMPMLKEKELLSAIRYQSDEFIPMPIEETNLDIEILQEDQANKTLTVLIVAAPKKFVSQIEKVLDLAGLTTGELMNELTAVGRFLAHSPKPPAPHATLVVNFGYSTSSMYLVDGKTSLILFARSFKVGLDLFLRDLKVNLNLDDAKSLEVLQTIGFSKSGSYDANTILAPVFKEFAGEIEKFAIIARDKFSTQIGEIKLCNYDTKLALLDKKLTEQFHIPASSLSAVPGLVQNPVSQSFASEISSFVPAIGASL